MTCTSACGLSELIFTPAVRTGAIEVTAGGKNTARAGVQKGAGQRETGPVGSKRKAARSGPEVTPGREILTRDGREMPGDDLPDPFAGGRGGRVDMRPRFHLSYER
jgi:hypothetical protein